MAGAGAVVTAEAMAVDNEACLGPFLADFCLSHCNIFVQCGESAQKAASGKNRPEAVDGGTTDQTSGLEGQAAKKTVANTHRTRFTISAKVSMDSVLKGRSDTLR